MSSGSDVVGAAMTAPVVSNVIALRTIREVRTASRYGPS
jgi:Cu/Ag efflux pump CusA